MLVTTWMNKSTNSRKESDNNFFVNQVFKEFYDENMPLNDWIYLLGCNEY